MCSQLLILLFKFHLVRSTFASHASRNARVRMPIEFPAEIFAFNASLKRKIKSQLERAERFVREFRRTNTIMFALLIRAIFSSVSLFTEANDLRAAHSWRTVSSNGIRIKFDSSLYPSTARFRKK